MGLFRSNGWNRLIYRLWAPVYDRLVGMRDFRVARQRAHEAIALKRGERVLLVGVGTGPDFALLPAGVEVVGVDLSPAMLAKARRKLPVEGCEVTLEQGDAARLRFEDGAFDVAVLNLILTVAADGAACLREAVRVTRPGGRILVFDKFLREGRKPGWGRRILGFFINITGTDINRSFSPMREGLPCRVVRDEAILFGGAYRAIVLERTVAETRD